MEDDKEVVVNLQWCRLNFTDLISLIIEDIFFGYGPSQKDELILAMHKPHRGT